MADLMGEIASRMAEARRGMERRRTLRLSYDAFRCRFPWRVLPALLRRWAFQFLVKLGREG